MDAINLRGVPFLRGDIGVAITVEPGEPLAALAASAEARWSCPHRTAVMDGCDPLPTEPGFGLHD